MKRNLNKDQYQLRAGERESLWHAIRRQTHGPAGHEAPQGAFRPALALTAVAATVTLMVAWHLGNRQLGLESELNPPQVAIVEIEETAPAAADLTDSRRELKNTAKSPDTRSARELGRAAAPAVKAAGTVLTGRVLDKASREPLAYANVLIIGTTQATVTDSLGRFRFADLPATRDIRLRVNMLSYDPVEIALQTPETGKLEQDFELEPVIVATLQAFDVQGAEYMVEVKSAVTEHTVTSETFEKYAIESVKDALSKKAGVVMRPGDVFVRGGRSGEVRMQVDGDSQASPKLRLSRPDSYGAGSVTGGTTAPNGEQVELMYFESDGVNPFVATEDDNLSTFALDVDNASWTVARSYLERGLLPPQDAIRVEEFVNTFDAGWPQHTDQPFRIHTEGAQSRFGEGYHLLRIGLVGKTVDDQNRKPANLIFVIDVSGSMARESRLELVKRALHILLDELREGDRVGLVVYGSHGQVRLPLTDISQRKKIAAAIDLLHTNGSTNAAEGLQLAYEMARENYDANIINRLILCSDGVANTGISTEAGGILDVVRKASDEGITLSTVGFGMGNYNDVLMEKLADQGDGNYNYVDKLNEAERVFRENLTSLLQTIAREVKVQVEFEEELVQRWRLLGYENRDVADKDFRNDSVDAGEVGAGHQVTALYELKLIQPAAGTPGSRSGARSRTARIGTVRLRHEAPAHDTQRAGQVTEIEQAIKLAQFDGDFAAGSPRMRVQTVVAEFAELLRGSYWARGHSLADLVPVADALAQELSEDPQVQDLARLVRQAADLAAQKDD